VTRAAPSRALPYAAVAFAAVSWGTWALIIRHTEVLGAMPAALEAAVVMGVITAVAGLASLGDRAPRRRTWRAWACVGWFGVADLLNVLLFFAAYKLTIAVAVLTHYMTPVFVALAAPLVLREKMSARTRLAIAVSLFGLAVMLVRSGGAGAGVMWTSAALGTCSALFYASNVLVNKFVVSSFSTSEAMFWHGVVATLLGLALVPGGAWKTVDGHAVAFLAMAAIGPGALGGLAFVWGLRRVPAAHASTLTLLEPVVSLLIGARVLGEPLGLRALAGGALILAGAVLVMTQGAEADESSPGLSTPEGIGSSPKSS
jgi:drug/metabolite transporter (DMT)-like permease